MPRPRIQAGEIGAVQITKLAGGRFRPRARMRDDRLAPATEGDGRHRRGRARRASPSGGFVDLRRCRSAHRLEHARRGRRRVARAGERAGGCRKPRPFDARVLRVRGVAHPESDVRRRHARTAHGRSVRPDHPGHHARRFAVEGTQSRARAEVGVGDAARAVRPHRIHRVRSRPRLHRAAEGRTGDLRRLGVGRGPGAVPRDAGWGGASTTTPTAPATTSR